MKKVAFCNYEYNAALPPYRFEPGDVVEIDDDWADQLVRRRIAQPAPAGARTVQQIRIESRPPVPTAADERAARRAVLQAELDALSYQDGNYSGDLSGPISGGRSSGHSGGHYGDMVTRGDADPPDETPDDGAVRPASAQAKKK